MMNESTNLSAAKPPGGDEQLDVRLDVLRRRVYRDRLVRALVMFLLGTLAVSAIGIGWLYVMGDSLRLWWAGVMAVLGLEGAMAIALWLDAKRSVPDRRTIALFADEQHPELENLILTATDVSSRRESQASAWMVEQLIGDPRLRSDRLSLSSGQRPGYQRVGQRLLLAGLVLLWPLLLVATRHMWMPPFAADYRGGVLGGSALIVEPGDARVRRGQNQVILAKVREGGPQAMLHWRASDGDWTDEAMTLGNSPNTHYATLRNIERAIRYRVSWNGLRSKEFLLKVWEPPEVESIDLTYVYPAYLELPARTVPGGGNISGVEGTRVEIRVAANKPLEEATLNFASGESLPLERRDELAWEGALVLSEDDRYHVELRDDEGELNLLKRDYAVNVRPDEPPNIRVKFPRGDSDPTPLDEVPFEFQVEDDFGIADYGLEYRVGDGQPVRLSLMDGKSDIEAIGTYVLALEEMGLKPGELVTWSAWARDRRPGRSDFEGFGDLYFMKLRPFAQRYQESLSQRSGSGGMGGDGPPELLELQKQVLIATWNLRSKLRSMPREIYDGNLAAILESELSVLQQVEAMAEESVDEEGRELFRDLSARLVDAVQALEKAHGAQAGTKLTEAEVHERQAYELMLANPDEVLRITAVNSMSGDQRRRNPAEVNELELDRNRNFYEEEGRPEQDQGKQDPILARLRELSARQALINAEIAKLISELEKARTEEEREELRRRLERLKEEIRQNLEQMDQLEEDLHSDDLSPQERREAIGRLDEARRQNASSLESLESSLESESDQKNRLQEARSSSRRALEQLESLQSDMADRSSQSIRDQFELFEERFRRFMEEQQDLRSRVEELRGESLAPGLRTPPDADAERQTLMRQARDLNPEFVRMMESAGALALQADASQPLVSKELGDWLRHTSASGIAEDLEAAHDALDYSLWEAAEETLGDTRNKLVEAERELARIRELFVDGSDDAAEIALDKIRSLMESAGLPSEDSGERSGLAADSEDSRGSGEGGEPGRGRRKQEVADQTRDSGPDGDQVAGSGDAPTDKSGTGGRGDLERSIDEPEFQIAWGDEGEDGTGRESPDTLDRHGSTPSEELFDETERSRIAAPNPDAGGQGEFGGEEQGAQDGERETSESESGSFGSPIDEDQGKPSSTGETQSDETGAGERTPNSRGEGEVPGDSETQGRDRHRDDPTWREGRGSAVPRSRGSQDMRRLDPETDAPGPGSSGRQFQELTDWPVDPEVLFGSRYREWVDQLRSVRTVLGGGDPIGEQIDLVALQMERLRREFKRQRRPPRFDLFLEGVAQPLSQMAAELEVRLQQSLRPDRFALLEGEKVPARYEKLVSDYFESLSSQRAQDPE